MRRPIVLTALVLFLVVTAVIAGGSAAQAKQKQEPIPWAPLSDGLADCIDFNSSTVCGPFGAPAGDTDVYSDFQETTMGSDPNNAASTPEYALFDEQTGSHTCSDGIDNDLDGHRDGSDAGCRLTCKDFGGGKRCSDPDHDGWLNYVEVAYGSDPNDESSTPETASLPATCYDGIDNDGDGVSDAADSGCGIVDCIDFTADSACLPF